MYVCDGAGVAVWAEYFNHEDSRVVALDFDLTLFWGNLNYLERKGFNQSRLRLVLRKSKAVHVRCHRLQWQRANAVPRNQRLQNKP